MQRTGTALSPLPARGRPEGSIAHDAAGSARRPLRWVTALTLALAATTPAMAVEFRSADVHNSDDYPTVAAVKHMSEVLNQRSGGKYKIKVFNKSALGTEKETLDQLKIGALEMNRVNISSLNSICPKSLVPTMPFLFHSVAHMRKVLDGPIGEEILKGCESQGMVGLAFYDSGSRSIYAKKAVRTPADSKGLKIRVQQSELWVAIASAIGANATPMPTSEIYTALKTGLIDAAENNIPSYAGFKHYEAVKVYSLTEHSMAPEMLLMSKLVWDKLSKADQDLFRAAAKESVSFQRQRWDEQEAKDKALVQKAGSQIVTDVDKAAFKAAMAPVYARFINTPDLQRLVKAVQDTP
ncbi:tripartite ATP-independent transporter DctP family solute receptor [Roseateles depolymerans]|uniref:C4-dicarboxylate ABC transporter n=2 Tax=Roseateles depolymerans TaxID=76731 RepID=A0A0U3MGM5_9BURK|nr:TRAP transporter substrate-binding protein [Roseateles depolymerans]ALV06652.1 C4-dicarboxylate ABC transporter [Roseateles depolymerans]REG19629.1 tripartite ATP-independent transporter DctP family solute receptor [Roseateles depolymerans]